MQFFPALSLLLAVSSPNAKRELVPPTTDPPMDISSPSRPIRNDLQTRRGEHRPKLIRFGAGYARRGNRQGFNASLDASLFRLWRRAELARFSVELLTSSQTLHYVRGKLAGLSYSGGRHGGRRWFIVQAPTLTLAHDPALDRDYLLEIDAVSVAGGLDGVGRLPPWLFLQGAIHAHLLRSQDAASNTNDRYRGWIMWDLEGEIGARSPRRDRLPLSLSFGARMGLTVAMASLGPQAVEPAMLDALAPYSWYGRATLALPVGSIPLRAYGRAGMDGEWRRCRYDEPGTEQGDLIECDNRGRWKGVFALHAGLAIDL